MGSEVKEALEELLKLDLDEKAQQLIVNLVSALAKSGCNITPKGKSREPPRLSLSPASSPEQRAEEPGVKWSPVPASPSLGTPSFKRTRLPVEGLKRQLLRSPPQSPEDKRSRTDDASLEEAWLELGSMGDGPPGEKGEMQEAWTMLDLLVDEAYRSYCEYRTRLSRAFKTYEEFCESYMSRDAIELTKKWRDFIMEHRNVAHSFDESKQRKQRGEKSPERKLMAQYEDIEKVIKRVLDQESRTQKQEEIQRYREQQRLCRQAEIARAAREMCYWKEEAQRAEQHALATSLKCDEIRRFRQALLKKVMEKERAFKDGE